MLSAVHPRKLFAAYFASFVAQTEALCDLDSSSL
jgi:hypothetical protein